MTEAVKKVIILGGGTSGWITAALLDAAHNQGKHRAIDITLVESAGGRIGVGEATIPTLLRTLKGIGIDERTFLAKTDATFKQGIRFNNWVKNPKGDPTESYWHPFDYPWNHKTIPLAHAWAERYDAGDTEIGAFADACGIQIRLMEQSRAPKSLAHPPYEGVAGYAYHLDAEKLGDYLAELCVERGVKRVIDKVVHVEQDEKGWIAALVTAEHGRIAGDLFVDCSGFQGLLINKVLGVPFQGYNDYLLCDRAVAMRTPYAEGQGIAPYTESTAQDAGWIWDIRLQSRRGSGYVYSTAFISDDAAEQALRRYVGPNAEGQQARILPMRVGRSREFWKHNCLAIGLAAGFIEPLESTGIALVEIGASLLSENFPYGGVAPAIARNYNRAMSDMYGELLDFINLHYCLTQRDDTAFWRAVREESRVTESLRERLGLWSHRPPREIDGDGPLKMFSYHSWNCILFGMGWRPKQWSGMHGYAAATKGDFDATFKEIRAASARLAMELPEHTAFLQQYR